MTFNLDIQSMKEDHQKCYLARFIRLKILEFGHCFSIVTERKHVLFYLKKIFIDISNFIQLNMLWMFG